MGLLSIASIQKNHYKLRSSIYFKQIATKVVGNFRENDLNLNGQGALLVPIYHQAIFSKPSKNFLVINIGGISNYTLLIGEKTKSSSDIGPGNVLLDNFCQKYFNINCDFEGVNSLMGKIN